MTQDQILALLKNIANNSPKGDVRFDIINTTVCTLFSMGLMSEYDFVHIYELLCANGIDVR